MVRKNNSRFFANKECEYYPCHKCNTDINCLFCFCPLYHLDCPGNYKITEKDGIKKKSCIGCVFPHVPENYDRIMQILKEQNGDR
ncbi:MAG: metal-binding protein [Lachnospiraceae bacterium]|nr:metal-binding protein [Lachnospiraceae bacterium]